MHKRHPRLIEDLGFFHSRESLILQKNTFNNARSGAFMLEIALGTQKHQQKCNLHVQPPPAHCRKSPNTQHKGRTFAASLHLNQYTYPSLQASHSP
jgi:hypothetical protein